MNDSMLDVTGYTSRRKRSLVVPVFRVVVVSAIALSGIAGSDGGVGTAFASSTVVLADTETRPTLLKCHDDTTYVSPVGFACSDHSQLDCNGFRHVGFSDREADELVRRCPSSCRVASCENDDDDDDDETSTTSTSKPTTALVHAQQLRKLHQTHQEPKWRAARSDGVILTSHTSHKVGGTSTRTGDTIHAHNDPPPPSNCPVDWDPTCQDDPFFHTHVGFHCAAHSNLDCTMFEKIGFTELQVWEIINSCPCSCRVECGTWTMSPTYSPTKYPTDAPTSFPTSSLTISPSLSPSASPMASPSAQPTTAPTGGPTDTASDAPSGSPTETLTEGPSSAPSLVPSRAPSTSPTASPSSTPSSKPSAVPSGEPSASPSAMPSSSPTSSPSSSPSSSPTSSPSSSLSSSPSASPSSIPSPNPSVAPSESSSSLPTSAPSSSAPTSSPSVSPSSPPTQSLAPSAHPSFLPSSIPTTSPSETPSGLPSLSPTLVPSFSPTNNPSNMPSPSPSAAPTSTPTPASVAMDTTFTIPLELNNNLTGGDALVVQEVMKTFLELNQKVGVDSKDSAVTIEVAGVYVEEVVPRSITGDAKRARSRMMKSKKSKQSGSEDGGEESEDGVDWRNSGDSIREDSTIAAALDTPVTSEVAAKLRIACNVYPHRPHVVDPGFQFVPRLLGGFASDFQPFLDHLARSSGTFTQPDFDPEAQERYVQPSQIPAASTAASTDATTTTPSPSIWNQIFDNKGLFIGIVVGASVFVMLLLSIIIISWRRHTRTRNYYDGGDDDESNAMDGEKEERPTVFYDNDGNEVYMTSKGQGYRHAASAPTPTNASWRQHVNAANSTRSKKTFSVFSPKGVFPDDIENEAYAMHQEQLKEERRRHEWEEQQIGGSFAKFNDNSSVQELVVNTEDSAGVDGVGSDSELSKKNKGHNGLLLAMKPIALGKDSSTRREDPTGAVVSSKLPPTTPRKYVRLDGDKNQLAPPDPPSHPRHASALQGKKRQSLS